MHARPWRNGGGGDQVVVCTIAQEGSFGRGMMLPRACGATDDQAVACVWLRRKAASAGESGGSTYIAPPKSAFDGGRRWRGQCARGNAAASVSGRTEMKRTVCLKVQKCDSLRISWHPGRSWRRISLSDCILPGSSCSEALTAVSYRNFVLSSCPKPRFRFNLRVRPGGAGNIGVDDNIGGDNSIDAARSVGISNVGSARVALVMSKASKAPATTISAKPPHQVG